MTTAEFLLSGTKPASLAGFVLVMAVLLVVLIERKLNWPTVFVAVLGAALCGINFIEIIRLGKNGLEISTQSGRTVLALAADVEKNKSEAAEAINNINLQISKLNDLQKSLTDQLSRLSANTASPDIQNSIKELKNKTDLQNQGILDLLNQNRKLSTSIQSQDQSLADKIKNLQMTLTRPGFSPT